MITNETIIANRILYIVRRDLILVWNFLKGKIPLNDEIDIILEALKSNKTPEKWWRHGFLMGDISLMEFFKNFLAKYEHIKKTVEVRKCEVFPVIPLGKLFDPIALILNYLWQFSMEYFVKYKKKYIFFSMFFK